jgi:hypothetical protein
MHARTHAATHHPPPPPTRTSLAALAAAGALLVEAACSVDRVDEALRTTLPLVPGLHYYRWPCACACVSHFRGEEGPFLRTLILTSWSRAARLSMEGGSVAADAGRGCWRWHCASGAQCPHNQAVCHGKWGCDAQYLFLYATPSPPSLAACFMPRLFARCNAIALDAPLLAATSQAFLP